MLEQVKQILNHPILKKIFKEAKQRKLKRLEERLNEQGNEKLS
jgi:hypothetical protein